MMNIVFPLSSIDSLTQEPQEQSSSSEAKTAKGEYRGFVHSSRHCMLLLQENEETAIEE